MARERLSEYRAKHIVAHALGQTYHGLELQRDNDWHTPVATISPKTRYVVKVDQAVGGRFKKGLVLLDLPASDVPAAATRLFDRGYRTLLAEPFTPHLASPELYLAIRRERTGEAVMASVHGGIDVEHQTGTIPARDFTPDVASTVENELGLPSGTISRLHTLFNAAHFSFLEINPLIIHHNQPLPLDLVVEVDAAAQNFVNNAWSPSDLRHATGSPEEAAVAELAARSPASLNLKALNPGGSIFALLSGGGASLVIVDEICHQGFGPLLGNFGEYSGDPSEDETYAYVRQVLHLLLRSPAKTKVLIIGGGVANFTDVLATFQGIIRALESVAPRLRTAGVKVYVRRGGPNAATGLATMRQFLEHERLLGLVAGPELGLADLVSAATASLKLVAA